MTGLVVQHQPVEGTYRLGESLMRAGLRVDVRRTYAGDPVPESADGLAGLVVMGGTMAAYADDGFPTRQAELALLRSAVEREVPTLGICLGAQLLAVAAGGDAVRGGGGLEVGWCSVRLTPEAVDDPLLGGLPSELVVLQWHADTYALPPAAVRLATGTAYPEQALRVGRAAWGLQFHLELDAPGVEAFLRQSPEDAPGPVGLAVRAEAPGRLAALEGPLRTVFDRFAAQCLGRDGVTSG